MTLAELKTLLDTSGIKFKYHHWDKPPSLPYGVYLFTSTDNFKADGKVYQKINNVIVELYTVIKDTVTEAALENVLDGAGIFYNKTESYIESEKMYQISYDFEII